MSTWLPDPTGRFARRPHFLQDEIEARCEAALQALFEGIGGSPSAISTEHLVVLAESITEEVDLFADLSPIGSDVEGATQFAPPGKPKIKIDRTLDTTKYAKRRRMTIAHEVGHVLLHDELFVHDETLDLFSDLSKHGNLYCKGKTLLPGNDWMEWQASYAGGSILMPRTLLQDHVKNVRGAEFGKTLPIGDKKTIQLIESASEHFDVSRDAAEIRLIQRGYIKPEIVQDLPF